MLIDFLWGYIAATWVVWAGVLLLSLFMGMLATVVQHDTLTHEEAARELLCPRCKPAAAHEPVVITTTSGDAVEIRVRPRP